MTNNNPPTDSDLPISIGGPATNALRLNGCMRLEHLTRFTEKELLALHGVGPKAIRLLREALAARGMAFASAPDKG